MFALSPDRASSNLSRVDRGGARTFAFRFVIAAEVAQRRLMKMRALTAAALACTIAAAGAASPSPPSTARIALTGGTVINPRDGRIVRNAVVLIKGDTIESVTPAGEAKVAEATRTVDCTGKFIVPGYIDTHVHFFQSGGLFTRPDVVDLNAVRRYEDELATIKSTLPDTFARHLRSGITSVVDVGGPLWNVEVRKLARQTAKAPRVAIAGPLISSVARPQLDRGDPPIVQINSPEKARELVRKLAAQKPDFIKIWYVVSPDSPIEKFRPIAQATIEESHRRKLRVAVHATE